MPQCLNILTHLSNNYRYKTCMLKFTTVGLSELCKVAWITALFANWYSFVSALFARVCDKKQFFSAYFVNKATGNLSGMYIIFHTCFNFLNFLFLRSFKDEKTIFRLNIPWCRQGFIIIANTNNFYFLPKSKDNKQSNKTLCLSRPKTVEKKYRFPSVT